MGQNSNIEWTHHTFNPWIGCTKVSAGCKNCYAETLDNNRFSRILGGGTKEIPVSHWGKGAPRHRTGKALWKEPLAWNRAAEAAGERQRVFCASLADVFDSEVPWMWRNDLFALIEKTPHLDWQILTKRPENIMSMLRQIGTHWGLQVDLPGIRTGNVWFGTSVEDQDAADKRIPELLKVPAVVRFLSMEPLLGPVDLSDMWLDSYWDASISDPITGRKGSFVVAETPDEAGINWVIAGGESGPGARPMAKEWAIALRNQCHNTGVPFLFKQWGEWMPSEDLPDSVGGHGLHIFPGPAAEMATRVGKKAAGRLLDGVTHDEFPAPVGQ